MGRSVGGRVFGFGHSCRPGSPGPALGPVALVAALLFAPGLARGATINVTTNQQQVNSDSDCSLQEAIFAANFDDNIAIDPANPGSLIDTGCTPGDPGTDTIALAPGEIYQVSGYVVDPFNPAGIAANPLVIGSIVLEGNGARLERVGGLDIRAFVVAPPSTLIAGPQAPEGLFSELTIRDLHVKGFRARGGDGFAGGGGGMGAGGAIFVYEGDLYLERCAFEDNAATGGSGGPAAPIPAAGGGGGGGLSFSATGGGGTSFGGGGGGGSRGAGGNGDASAGGGGGGTLGDGANGSGGVGGAGGFLCGGKGGDFPSNPGGFGLCEGGGAGGGGADDGSGFGGSGGPGAVGGGGGGGGAANSGPTGFGGVGGPGGFGGGGGAGGSGQSLSGDGGPGGFGGGGGAAGGALAGPAGGGSDGSGGPFAGNAGAGQGGGGAGLGGAIFVGFGSLYVSNSTFDSNGAFGGLAGGPGATDGRGAGGAIFLLLSGLQMNHGTVTGSSGEGSIFSQADFFVGPDAPEGIDGELLLLNSIVADHTDPMQPNCIVECDDCGPIEFGTNNLDNSNVGNDCVGTTQTGDPLLDPLAIYPPGVPTMTPLTPTRRLQSASPAIDNADADSCLATDQRGVVRPQLLGCDIGAYERDTFPTTTTLVCAPNPSLYTQLVTCTATVTATEGGTPAGAVAFAVDSGASFNVTLDGAGQASFSTSTLTVGVHQVDADYLGSPVHDPSSATPFLQTVNPIPTTTALVCAPNPSLYTQLVTCTATVTPTFGMLVPTGTITFAVDAVPQAPVALDGAGQASFSTSSLTVGMHLVDASYSGATEFLPSVAPQVVQVVQPIPTATSVVCAPDPSFYAQEVVCTATVVSTFGVLVPVGDVAFAIDAAPAGTVTLDGAGQASISTSSLEVGEHPVIASFLGSTNFAPSVSPQFDQTVVKIPTGTTLDVAPNPALVGSTVGFTATVVKTEPYDGLPTGDVVFSIDGVDEPPVPIDGAGVAILYKAANDIGAGDHLIGARYLGEPHFEESAAADVLLRIVTIQEIPTLDASGLAALILLLAAGALTILVRRRGPGSHRH